MPPSGNRKIYAGGFSEEKKKKLEATKLPQKIRCKQCKKLKSVVGYSQRQLNNLRQEVAYNPHLLDGGKASSILCRACTEGQVTELECVQCGFVKSLEGFTKAQRRNPDRARCYECVNDAAKELVAGDDFTELRSSDSSDDDYDYDDDADEQASVAESNAHASSFASDGEDSSAIVRRTRDMALDEAQSSSSKHPAVMAWKEMAQGGRHGSAGDSANREKTPTVYTGYDASGRAHERVRSPTVASDDSPPPSQVAPRSNFPRVKAYAPSSSSKFGRAPKVFRNTGITVPDEAKAAVGRQREDYDSGSDSDFGKI